eukprot:SAG11_NODE_2626_length_3163_cov_1.351175_2_plen_113_part_00
MSKDPETRLNHPPRSIIKALVAHKLPSVGSRRPAATTRADEISLISDSDDEQEKVAAASVGGSDAITVKLRGVQIAGFGNERAFKITTTRPLQHLFGAQAHPRPNRPNTPRV